MTDILVTSPAAGGLVRIDRETGGAQVIPLDEDIGWLGHDPPGNRERQALELERQRLLVARQLQIVPLKVVYRLFQSGTNLGQGRFRLVMWYANGDFGHSSIRRRDRGKERQSDG